MSERLLVTGAAGFIGAHVCRTLLEDGHDVIGVDNFDPFYDRAIKEGALDELRSQKSFEFHELDIRDAGVLEKPLAGVTAVIHLAARAGVRPSIEMPQLYFSLNTDATVTLLEANRRAGVKRFIFGSSSSVYGDTTPVPIREDAPSIEPISPYAASKRAAELGCRVFTHLHGMRIAALRFFTVYGPRQRPDLAIQRFTRLIHEGKPIPQYGDGSAERDYTWVGDIAQGVTGAVAWSKHDDPAFEIFNLGESQTVRLDRLIQLIGDAMGVTPQIEVLPPAPGDVRRTCADISKARRILGYDPAVSIEDGIRRFVQWHEQSRNHTTTAAVRSPR